MSRSRDYAPSCRTVLIRINPEQYDAIMMDGRPSSAVVESWHRSSQGVAESWTPDARHFRRKLVRVRGGTHRRSGLPRHNI